MFALRESRNRKKREQREKSEENKEKERESKELCTKKKKTIELVKLQCFLLLEKQRSSKLFCQMD